MSNNIIENTFGPRLFSQTEMVTKEEFKTNIDTISNTIIADEEYLASVGASVDIIFNRVNGIENYIVKHSEKHLEIDKRLTALTVANVVLSVVVAGLIIYNIFG